MAEKKKVSITLACDVCKNRNYHFMRGKKKEFKLELKKFCNTCGKQTAHKETKG